MNDNIARIATWLQPQAFLLDVDVQNRQHALEVLASAICRSHGLDAARVCRALMRRERVGSTGLGGGFAIPHARILGIEQPTTLLLRTKTPIAFDAPDGKPVSMLLAIMVPEEGSNDDHLRLLALVAELFSSASFYRRLHDAGSEPEAAQVCRDGIAKLVLSHP